MIKEQARVVALDVKSVWVEKTQAYACSACQNNCLSSALNSFNKTKRLQIETDLSLSLGDEVWVCIDEHAFVYSILCVYLAPLGVFLVGSLIGQAFFAAPFLAGLIAFGLYFILLKYCRVFERRFFKPFIWVV